MDDVRSCFEKDFPFRAFVHVHQPPAMSGARVQLSAAEAVQVAHLAVSALREAWSKYKVRGVVHLFLAVPAGLAFMTGQLLNGFGDVQTYEHVPTQKPCYVSAALLRPST
jgi:SMODS-associated and fused to various effectors sensor domain